VARWNDDGSKYIGRFAMGLFMQLQNPFQSRTRWLAAVARHLPGQCLICHRWPAAAVCADCLARFATPTARCQRCAAPLPAAGQPVCGACLRQPPPLERCVSAVSYGWPWSDWIARLKFHQDVGLALPMAALMARAPEAQALLADSDSVVPIALSRQRLAERGYNQALLLARALVAARKLQPDWLARTRHTAAQHDLPRQQRLSNLRGVFCMPPEKTPDVHNQRVLLIDDVSTTGATLRAAAQALLQAGAAQVSALVFAHTD
jgi:ComF family protein